MIDNILTDLHLASLEGMAIRDPCGLRGIGGGGAIVLPPDWWLTIC